VREDLIGDAGSLSSATSIANDATTFTLPRAAVAVGEQLAFVATDERVGARDREEAGARAAIFLQRDDGEAARRLAVSADLVSPFDIDVSLDQRTLYVADFAGGKSGLGAIAVTSVVGGALSFAAEGFSPRGVTVAPGGEVLFSGIDPASGLPGVFVLEDGSVRALFTGAPLVDPSGIAAFADGRVLVADTRAFDAAGAPLANEAGVVLIDEGRASLFASGFATGFPAGIALTEDESSLLVSAESADRHDTLLLFDVAPPAAPPRAVTASFSALQDAAAGLKRAHDKDEFSFASLAANGGGTVFRIE
jgi:DNA-binding beta-propeller fold protein YncE